MIRLITDKSPVVQEFGVLPRPRELGYGTKAAIAAGMLPVEEYPDVLVPEDEWKERIQAAHAKKMMPIHRFEANDVKAKSQGSTNYCWAYGLGSALEDTQLLQAQPYCRLAPASLGWLVNWRNVGYYLSETIRGAATRGICSSKFAPDGVTHYHGFEPGWEEDGLKHCPREWFDTNGNERQMAKMCVSLLLATVPLYIAYNWWGHALAMVGVLWDEREKYNLRWIGWNSHGDGRIELVGSRGVPDEAYGLRSSTFDPS